MNDTERMERVEIASPGSARARSTATAVRSEIDLTPTTTPSWVAQVQMPLPVEPPTTPAPRGKRLARGTMPPRLSRLPLIPRPLPSIHELPARLVPPPRRWGRVVRVDLDGAPIARSLPALPRHSFSPLPLVGVLLAGIATLALALAAEVQGTAALAAEVQGTAAPAAEVQGTAAPAAEVQGTAASGRIPAEPTITPILAPGEGLLAIAATTTCRILIDGHDTGLVTPQRELRLAAGRHRVTLVDDANGLEDHSEIEIGATPATITRDLSAFLR